MWPAGSEELNRQILKEEEVPGFESEEEKNTLRRGRGPHSFPFAFPFLFPFPFQSNPFPFSFREGGARCGSFWKDAGKKQPLVGPHSLRKLLA